MTDQAGIKRDCPKCGKPLSVIEKVPGQMFDAEKSRVSAPLAAWLYLCGTHGFFVINIRGDVWAVGSGGEQ